MANTESHKNSEILPIGTRVALKYDRFNPSVGEVVGYTNKGDKMYIQWNTHRYICPYLPVELRRI